MGAEQRVHSRIHVSSQIEVSCDRGMVEAELKDLSMGGARFEVAIPVGAVGDTVELFLPSLDRNEIVVMAEIVRHQVEPGDRHAFAVRFDLVEPAMQQALVDLLGILLSSGSGGEARAHPRVARRIEIRFGQLEELRGILENISSGGLMMTVHEPLVLYEELDVTVPDLSGGELLILHAKVVNQRAVTREDRGMSRVGLEFATLRPEAQHCLDALLRAVVEATARE